MPGGYKLGSDAGEPAAYIRMAEPRMAFWHSNCSHRIKAIPLAHNFRDDQILSITLLALGYQATVTCHHAVYGVAQILPSRDLRMVITGAVTA